MSEEGLTKKLLRITVTQGALRLFEDTFNRSPVYFGRSPKADIPLNFDFVSRVHGRLFEENGRWYVEDLKSSNGITTSGQRVEKVALDEHPQFQIGPIQFTIHIMDVVETAAADATPVQKNPDDEVTASTDLNFMSTRATGTGTIGSTAPHITGVTRPTQSLTSPSFSFSVNRGKNVPTLDLMNEDTTGAGRARSGPHFSTDPSKKTHLRHKAVLAQDVTGQFLQHHPQLNVQKGYHIETVVTWYDQVYDCREFPIGEVITIGPVGYARLPIPTLTEPLALVRASGGRAHCFVPEGMGVQLQRGQHRLVTGDLIAQNLLEQRDIGYRIDIALGDVLSVEFGFGIKIHIRFVPISPYLGSARHVEPDQALKQSLMSSFVMHAVLLALVWLSAPTEPPAPKIKNVPERFARLLMQKPKPKPTPAPTPVPKKKEEIVKKKTPPREHKVVHTKPKQVPKIIQKVNKFPMVVKHPMPKAPPPVKVESLGALAALGAISKNAPTNVVTNININPHAGGLQTKSLNTGGIVGALPSANGKLAAGGGFAGVKTKGMGFGTGTGYGIQGLKGTAGSRAVAGAIVGTPKLAQVTKEEGLTRAQVMAVVQKYLSEVQHCYERNLMMNPNLAGRMEFEWDISPGGSVTDVRIKRSTVNSGDDLGECVKNIFMSMHFPRGKNGLTTTPSIGFPFGRL